MTTSETTVYVVVVEDNVRSCKQFAYKGGWTTLTHARIFYTQSEARAVARRRNVNEVWRIAVYEMFESRGESTMVGLVPGRSVIGSYTTRRLGREVWPEPNVVEHLGRIKPEKI